MPRRICHLIDTNTDTVFFHWIAQHHDRAHFPVTVGSLAPEGPLQRAMAGCGLPTFSLNVRGRVAYPAAIAALARFLRQERMTLLHAHCFDPTAVGLLAARLAGCKMVFTRHHSDHHVRMGKRWHTRVDAWCARKADHVIAVSEAARRVMTEVERVPADHISVVYNGMEPARKPEAVGMDNLRRSLGLGQTPACLVVARLHEEKGHRYLFEELGTILKNAGPVVFLLAGEGPHRRQLEEDVRRRGFESVVRFLGWRDDIPELMSIASVVVLPSLAESFGVSLVEAMSLGLPIVATTTGGIPEVVEDNISGLLVPPADSTALGSAICRLLKDPALAESLGRAGRVRAGRFGSESMVRGYERVYEKLV